MRAIFSLWTGARKFTYRRDHLLIATLAHCFALQSFGCVEYVTDFRGQELARRLGWKFSEVTPALEILRDCATPNIWALGKLVSLTTQSAPVCHLDFDFFLQKPLPDRMKSASLIAQSVDWPHHYIGQQMRAALRLAGLPGESMAFNAGIIGGADIPMVHDYANAAIELSQRFERADLSDGTTISMVIEQYHLGLFSKANKVKVETLLPMSPTKEECADVGATHLHGSSKRDAGNVRKAARRMRDQFPDAYKAFLGGWKELQEDFA